MVRLYNEQLNTNANDAAHETSRGKAEGLATVRADDLLDGWFREPGSERIGSRPPPAWSSIPATASQHMIDELADRWFR